MAYTDVIPLEEVKNFLRIEPFLVDQDAELTRMLKSSCQYVERVTGHIFFPRDKEYILNNSCVRVYDFPINSVIDPVSADDYKESKRPLYSTYDVYDYNTDVITLNVGYSSPEDIPSDLKDVVLAMIDFMYYGKGQEEVKGQYPLMITQMIESNKRFVL